MVYCFVVTSGLPALPSVLAIQTLPQNGHFLVCSLGGLTHLPLDFVFRQKGMKNSVELAAASATDY